LPLYLDRPAVLHVGLKPPPPFPRPGCARRSTSVFFFYRRQLKGLFVGPLCFPPHSFSPDYALGWSPAGLPPGRDCLLSLSVWRKKRFPFFAFWFRPFGAASFYGVFVPDQVTSHRCLGHASFSLVPLFFFFYPPPQNRGRLKCVVCTG